jgi:hypothetical protein
VRHPRSKALVVAPARRSLRHSTQLLRTPGTSARANAKGIPPCPVEAAPKMSSEDVSESDETRTIDERPCRGEQ